MKKEDLVTLGVSEEIAEKIVAMAAEEAKGFIPKSRFDEVNEAKKNAESLLKERDTQLEALKKSGEGNESLKKQIEELQEANKATVKKYESDIKNMQIDNAVEKAITGANGKNVKAIRALLNLDKAELDPDGSVKGLSDQIETLSKAEDSSFLFGSSVPQVKGTTPADGIKPTETDTSKMSYSELCDYLANNPEAKL